jgi:type IV pilus assembly protein PilA
MHRSGERNGFTLIELLIVIIIVGILCAIAIPLYINQRDKAKDAAVKGGCHVIELGLGSYAVEHIDNYPAGPITKASLVDGSGVSYVDNWPHNPWTGVDMTDNASKGNYSYTLIDVNTFTLLGWGSKGTSSPANAVIALP